MDMQDTAGLRNSQALYNTSERLEDKLLYDDVFVDYFNVFLQLEAFIVPLRYEKLDGFYLEELEQNDPELRQLVDDRGKFYWQGAVIAWIKEHRLPYFLRSYLFLEFKLCKLLLRKLFETSRVQCQSQLGLRGYSQADSPFPVSLCYSSSPVGCGSQASWPREGSTHYKRPLGSACSLPAMLSLALETRLKLLEGPPAAEGQGGVAKLLEERDSTGQKLSNDFSKYEIQFEMMHNPEELHKGDVFDTHGKYVSRSQITSAQCKRVKNCKKGRTPLFTSPFEKREETITRVLTCSSGRRRTRSAPVHGGLGMRTNSHDLFLDDYELDLPFEEDDTILDFNEPKHDEIDAELQSIVDGNKKNLQELKEDALKSTLGMKDFRDFLDGTSGIHLFNFWLDVEKYKDLEESNRESQHTLQMLRLNLFREINDKYKNYLTVEAKQAVTEALNHDGLTKDLFTRTQYDMLRRLRSYWIPRFLVHKEKTRNLRMVNDQRSKGTGSESSLSFLPTISIVHSLPPRGDWCRELARQSCDWSKNLVLGDQRARSPQRKMNSAAQTEEEYEKFLRGISSEKEAGWPFRYFLEKINKKDELANLLFWQSIEDLKNEEMRGCDRHLHLCNAWSIVKRYLSDEAEMVVNMNELARHKIIEKLRKAVEVSSTLFKSAQNHALVILRAPWEEYKKDDQQTLFKYPESSPSERQRRLHTALTIAEDIQATRMSRQSPEKSQASTRKGRSAGNNPKTMKPSTKEKSVKFNAEKENKKQKETIRHSVDVDGVKIPEEAPPEFTDIVGDKVIMSSFKHFIQNTEGRTAMNNLAMFLDVESYKAIPSSRKAERTQLAMQIFKDFFDSSSRKNIELPSRIPYEVENECPSTPTLVKAQQYVCPEIQASFAEFYKSHRVPKVVTETDTSHPVCKAAAKSDTPHTSSSFLVYYKRRRNKFKGPGRLQPTKEDKASFVKELRDTYGTLSVRLELFRRYLDSNDDVQGESISKLENDLFFYFQVQKFKDLFFYMDDLTLTKKVDAIVDCFLDSATPPSVQIDIGSDLAGKIVHKAQSFRTRSKIPREQRDAQIFDEAQNIVLKELLPFWASFTRQHDSPSTEPEPDELPLTRRQLMMKRRYSDFKKFPSNKRPTSLRSVLPRTGESKRELNFTIADGLAWKESIGEDADSIYSGNIGDSTRSGTRELTRDNFSSSRKNSIFL